MSSWLGHLTPGLTHKSCPALCELSALRLYWAPKPTICPPWITICLPEGGMVNTVSTPENKLYVCVRKADYFPHLLYVLSVLFVVTPKHSVVYFSMCSLLDVSWMTRKQHLVLLVQLKFVNNLSSQFVFPSFALLPHLTDNSKNDQHQEERTFSKSEMSENIQIRSLWNESHFNEDRFEQTNRWCQTQEQQRQWFNYVGWLVGKRLNTDMMQKEKYTQEWANCHLNNGITQQQCCSQQQSSQNQDSFPMLCP